MTKGAAFLFCISTLASTLWNPTSATAACDPDKILRQNVEQYNESISVFLSYLRNLQSSTDESSKTGIGLSYAGIGLSYDDAKSLSQYLSLYENYVISKEQSISVLRSTLSPDSVRAYIACLKSNDPVTVIIPDTALNEPVFQFTVEWNPNFRAKADHLTVNVTNGTIKGRKSATVFMQPTDSFPFELKRDGKGDKTLFITAHIAGKTSDPASLPGIPQFRLTLKPTSAPPPGQPEADIKRSGHYGTSYVKDDYCVTPKADSILIPSTLKFVGRIVGDPGRARSGIYPNNTSQRACGYIENSAGANEDFNEIRGRFVAFQTDLSPVTAAPPPVTAGPPIAKRLEGDRVTNRFEDVESIMKELSDEAGGGSPASEQETTSK